MEFTSNSNNYKEKINLTNYQEYYLIKENIIYKIAIEKNDEEIFIKCKNYLISFNHKDLSLLTKEKFNTINKAYEFIFNIFEENKIIIKNIIINKEIILLINNERETKITLKYNKEYKNINFSINDINQIKNEIISLKEENKILKDEINKLKKYHGNNNPNGVNLLSNISKDSYVDFILDNTFVVFKSINDILYLIYSNKKKSIICYDLNEKRKINELKNYHKEYITNFRHYLDKINKRDLIMSISCKNNNIKIWNVNNWECILNLTNINKQGYLLSSCFLNQNNNIYIITSNYNNTGNSELIKIFGFDSKKIKEIQNSNEKTYFIDIYYDNILSKYYIITGNYNFTKSYDYENNNIYHIFNDNNSGSYIKSIIIKNYKGIIKLIESCNDGIIRIFNFHSGLLLNKIQITNAMLCGICLWNENYLFVGCSDKTIKIIEIKSGLIVKSLTGHNNWVLTIKKIFHKEYGECLISQNWKESEIKLWINDN